MDFFVALSAVMAFCTALSAVLQKKGQRLETVVAGLAMTTIIMMVTMVVTLVIGHDGYRAWSVASAFAWLTLTLAVWRSYAIKSGAGRVFAQMRDE
ncbi:MAG: hypothetical protein ACM3KF_03750 [Acidobacteriota bacterium]